MTVSIIYFVIKMKMYRVKGIHEFDTNFQYTIIDNNLFCDNKILLWTWVYHSLAQKYKQQYDSLKKTIQQQNRLDISRWPKQLVIRFFNKIKLQEIKGIKTREQAQYLFIYIDSNDLKLILGIKQKVTSDKISFIAAYYDDNQLLYQKIKNFEIKTLQVTGYFQQTCQIIDQIILKPEQIYTSLEKIAGSQMQLSDPWAKQKIFYMYGNCFVVHDYIEKFVKQYNKIKLQQLDHQDPNFNSYLYCYLKSAQKNLKKVAKMITYPKLCLLFHVDYCKLSRVPEDCYSYLIFEDKLQKLMNQDKTFQDMIHYSKQIYYLTMDRIVGQKNKIEQIKRIVHEQLPAYNYEQLKQKQVHKFIDTLRINVSKEHLRYFLAQFDRYKLKDQDPFFITFKSSMEITNYLQFSNKIFIIFKQPEEIINLQSVVRGFQMELSKYLPIIEFFNNQEEETVYRHSFQYGSEFIFIRRQNSKSWDQHIIKTIHQQNSLTKAIIINSKYFTELLENSHKIQNFCTVVIENGNLADTRMKLANFQKQVKESRVNVLSHSKCQTLEERNLLQLVQQLLTKNIKKYIIKKASREGDKTPIGYVVDPVSCYNIAIRCLKQYQCSSIPVPIDSNNTQYVFLTYYQKLFMVKRCENGKFTQLSEIKDASKQLEKIEYKAFQRLKREALFFGYQFFLLFGNKTLASIQNVEKLQESLEVNRQVDYYTLKFWQRNIFVKKNSYSLRTIKHNQSKSMEAKLFLEQILKQKYWPLTPKIPVLNKKAIQFIASANIGYGVFKKSKDPNNPQLVFFEGSYQIVSTFIQKLLQALK